MVEPRLNTDVTGSQVCDPPPSQELLGNGISGSPEDVQLYRWGHAVGSCKDILSSGLTHWL